MGFRPGKTKGPWVGPNATSGGGDTVKVSSDDTAADYLENKLLEGLAQDIAVLSPSGNEKLELTHGIQGFCDEFRGVRPFWEGSPVLTSGHWNIDTFNGYMVGISGEGQDRDEVRVGVEGDFDYAFKFEHNPEVSTKITVTNEYESVKASIEINAGILYFAVTGKADIQIANPANTIWLRLKRYNMASHIAAYYKVADSDPWTLLGEYNDVYLGYGAILWLDAAIGTKVLDISLYDNRFPTGVRSGFSKWEVPVTAGANVTIDASKGNFFSFTLTENALVGAPSNPSPNQLMMLRVKQGGVGGWSLSWNAVFAFSASLPAPTLTATAGRTDLLGFVYNRDLDKWLYIAEVKDFNV